MFTEKKSPFFKKKNSENLKEELKKIFFACSSDELGRGLKVKTKFQMKKVNANI